MSSGVVIRYMAGNINRRKVLQRMGALGAIGGFSGWVKRGDRSEAQQGPDLLNIIGYPESGIQIFRDYYGNFQPNHDIIVPDGLQDSSLPGEVGDPMEEVRGTAPGSSGPNEDAFNQLYQDQYDQASGVFNSHTYDAVAVCILANIAAGENDGQAVRDQMRRVANPEGEEYGPGAFVEAAEAVANGEDVNYQGASSSVNFDDVGDPADTAYDVWQFAGNEIEVLDTIEFEGEGPGGEMADESPGGLGREVRVAILLPETGDLGSVGSPMIQAGRLPAQQINESDLDLSVDLTVEDTQTAREASLSAGEALVNAGYPAIVGAASSGNSVPLTDVTSSAGVVQCSPASTALSLSNIEDDGYFFRTAPSDLLQGQVMAQVAAERLGAQSASTLYVNNDYGQQLSEQFSQSFQEDQGGEILRQVSFEIGQGSYTAQLESALRP